VQAETAQRRLRDLILDGTYPLGARLTEVDAAAALTMSRTPVREALRALAADGLVRPAGRGVVVAALEGAELDEAYQVRAALEALAAELAAGRQRAGRIAPADLASLRRIASATAASTTRGRLAEAAGLNRRFHRRIAELAGNATALRVLDRLWDQIQVSTVGSLRPPARRKQASDQHERLLQAIVDGQVGTAGRIARRHVLHTRSAVAPIGRAPE
jgi:DNA-binding GntR family transcriptional regulator